ncbi:hypothetical protein Gotur_027078 [Gossypium turneri]
MYQSCVTSLVLVWANTCFMPSPNFGILLIVISLLGEVIWYLQWRSTWIYFVARRFKKIENLRDLILAHLDAKKKVDVFALSVYGLVVFLKALGHVDEVVTDLLTDLIRGLHQSRKFWQKPSDC